MRHSAEASGVQRVNPSALKTMLGWCRECERVALAKQSGGVIQDTKDQFVFHYFSWGGIDFVSEEA